MLRVVIVFMLLTLPAVARDFGQWEDQPSSARQWFQRLMRPDNPYQSCCGEADAFEADTSRSLTTNTWLSSPTAKESFLTEPKSPCQIGN
jgi:hypothetical protein